MRTEMNLDVVVCNQEERTLESACMVLDGIANNLSYLKENGYYPFLDEIHLPKQVRDIIEVAERVNKLSDFCE